MNRFSRATLFLSVIAVFAFRSNLQADPMVYTGLVVTDVRVGTTLMHNASLKITFEGDTANINPVVFPGTQTQFPSQVCGGTGYFFYLSKGVTSMEIEFQGRTRTATLADGQVFVALDTCSGGIGFGSFIGPSGLEPAYPLALTLGTAEYDSVTPGNPLLFPLSMTGAAWSCIGFPPLGKFALPGTANGNCTPPDKYPLKSDIGEIFIYQRYYELSGTTAIASNHAGSTNRGAFLVRPRGNAPDATLSPSGSAGTSATIGTSESADASGVVYTLQTVADGSIGNHAFNQALVTFQMVSDTKWVTSQPSPVDPRKTLYENRVGHVTVTVDDGGQVISADFAPGQVYARYDTGAGVAGFGSQISPTYPIALNCSNSAYPSDKNYKADCLQGEAWNYINFDFLSDLFQSGILAQLSDPFNPSAGVKALPQSLSQNTLLAGTAHACAGVYTFFSVGLLPYFPGDLGWCLAPAPRGLQTSKGQLFLQDLEGGTLDLGNAPVVEQEDGTTGGWDLANSGFLRVEVFKGDN